MNNLLKIFVFFILTLFSSFSYSQSGFDEFENSINVYCSNCNQSEVNKFIVNESLKLDSMLTKKIRFLVEKIDTLENVNFYERYKLKKSFRKSYRSLLKSRKKIVLNFNELTEGGFNKYYTSILYWYYTDKIVEVISEMEETIFGD
ncbi:hypothetical protein [Algoriphagus sp. A40]|uniref:hypothetical protein n=1 Tax=Algoriphagus sp. A40 TaxID=1945863 RepID=UPI0011158079|nr:hypothetical protein [Algoriphagus sp. A40]